jgi:hypothetical protein
MDPIKNTISKLGELALRDIGLGYISYIVIYMQTYLIIGDSRETAT